jgi:DNA-binding SARP family transcriptional activator
VTRQVQYRLLGPLEVARDGELLELGGAKQRAVLAILLLEAGRAVSTDRLIEDLWSEQAPGRPKTAIQGYVSGLRKVLGAGVIETVAVGYVLRADLDQLDLHRFERLFSDAHALLGSGDPVAAADMYRQALDLWRGPPLVDFAYESFAQQAINRLEGLQLACVEERIEADLACGRHAELIGELEVLAREQPLRERLHGQLMLALYRSGRQADSLDAYRNVRRQLVEELGIEPTPALQQLERDILMQATGLDLVTAEHTPAAAEAAPARARPDRSILLVPSGGVAPLLEVAEPLARSPHAHELILATLLDTANDPVAEGELADASSELRQLRDDLACRGVVARVAAFTSSDVAGDLVRLASEQEVDLVLIEVDADHLAEKPAPRLHALLVDAPSDVALLVDRNRVRQDGPVLVPFGGADHDWAALELAAWLASAHEAALFLLGVERDRRAGRRDASRLLATASLAVQQLVGVVAEPLLVPPGADGILGPAERAAFLIVGLSSDWQSEGLGAVRAELALTARTPTLFVRRGLRPGGLAPRESFTRFTWSLSDARQLPEERSRGRPSKAAGPAERSISS